MSTLCVVLIPHTQLLDEIIRDTSIEEAASTGFRLYYDPVEAKELDTKTLVEIEIGAVEVLSIIGIGSAIVVIATGLSSISVIRMKPKEILSSIS